MLITRSAAKERILLDALRASLHEERTGTHLSDLIKIRQAAWKRFIPLPPTDIDALYFLAGRGHEEVFARLCGVQVGATTVKHVAVPEFVPGEQRFHNGVSYRPDFRWYRLPTEFKTRRSNLAKEGEEATVYDGYLDQLKGYVAYDYAASGEVDAGHLIVLSLLEGKSLANPLKPSAPELAVYDVQFARQELVEMLQLLTDRRVQFERANGAGEDRVAEIQKLPLCAAWMCGKNHKTVLKAAHCVECDKDLYEPWASKHSSTKTGRGHTVTPEEVRWDYVPRCAHYSLCRPQDIDPTRGER